jgi:SAM-dependent methyltransferase
VFCLEVLEHLPERETADALNEIARLLKPKGSAVIGVPHELFLPALIKGLFRMTRRYGSFDARPRGVLAAVVGRPPAVRPIKEITPGFAYHKPHLGFDYRVLEERLQAVGKVQKWFSPLRSLGRVLNSEVYFLVQKR